MVFANMPQNPTHPFFNRPGKVATTSFAISLAEFREVVQSGRPMLPGANS